MILRDGLPVCICGEVVAVPHGECMALMTREQQERWESDFNVD